jgi:hypothetical protein
MGQPQALVADLEAGATRIREYQQTIIPGLLQTPELTRARIQADDTASRARRGRAPAGRMPF